LQESSTFSGIVSGIKWSTQSDFAQYIRAANLD
jgi:hypothetical protein